FGMVVDSSVVMIENCVRRLSVVSSPSSVASENQAIDQTNGSQSSDHGRAVDHLSLIRDAAVEVRKPTLFGELIILIVYLPILTLEGIEGKLFRPMALTVMFALAGSMILSMTLMPVLASLFLPKRISDHEPILLRIAKAIYVPILHWTM